MTPTEPAPATDGGFVHLGVLPRNADDLVTCLAAELSVARERGHRVLTVLDRPTGRRLREALGALSGDDAADGGADDVDALVPGAVHAGPPEELLATVRASLASCGRVLLVLQWLDDADAARLAERERALADLFADEPVTLVCAAPCAAAQELVTVLCDAHPQVLDRTGRRPNMQGPVDRQADDPRRATLRTAVRGPSDLRGVRQSVARMAGGVGLDTDETAAAVLAVHEAALIATGIDDAERAGRTRTGDGPELPPGTACVVEVRTEGATLVTEVTGPAAGPEPCLRVVRLFAADAEIQDAVQDGVPVRAVRVRSASA